MLPSKIQEIIFEVRQGDKHTLDFKNVVTAYLIDTYDLNELQAAICYKRGETKHADFYFLFIEADENAKFAHKILKNR